MTATRSENLYSTIPRRCNRDAHARTYSRGIWGTGANGTAIRELRPKVNVGARDRHQARANYNSWTTGSHLMGLSLLDHFRVTSEEQGLLRDLLLQSEGSSAGKMRHCSARPARDERPAGDRAAIDSRAIPGFIIKYHPEEEEGEN
jgi:hypothetical protein